MKPTTTKRLLVSYHLIEEKLKEHKPNLNHSGLFINHTLWNRDANRIYFFARAEWDDHGGDKVNQPFSIHSDGTGLMLHEKHIGGYPEWAEGRLLIGRDADWQILYDVDAKRIVGQLGDATIFPKPEGDVALSPDGNWLVNGYKKGDKNHYAVYRRSDGVFAHSEGIDKGSYSGNIRIDPVPRWNRSNDAILIPGIAKNKTRHMFLIRIIPQGGSALNDAPNLVTIAADQQQAFDEYVAGVLDGKNLPSPATVRRARSVHLEWDDSELHVDSQLWANSQRVFQKVTFVEGPVPFDVEFTIRPHALDILLPK